MNKYLTNVFFILFIFCSAWLIQNVRFYKTKQRKKFEKIVFKKWLEKYKNIENTLRKQIEKEKIFFKYNEKKYMQVFSELAIANEKLKFFDHVYLENEMLKKKLQKQVEINNEKEKKIQEVKIYLSTIESSENTNKKLLKSYEQYLESKFEILASRIFEKTEQKINKTHCQKVDNILTPFRAHLDYFRKQIQENFHQEAREHISLVHEIKHLKDLNKKIAEEALNLTKALKGNKKIQGNWGELVLSRILETSGLREGYEYDSQVNIEVENHRMQPDIIIRLPQGKDIIIDSKMTLIAYERYFNNDDEKIQKKALNDHIAAIRTHFRNLSYKNYHTLPGIRSLDYILMFIPIEPAFLLAINSQPELINEALKLNIMLVSPTTLLVALRTINNLWRYEQQNHNAQKIANRAAKMYDKMRLFVEDMTNIGNSIEKIKKTYHTAIKKLSTGKGNLISQTESFKHLGIETTKDINVDVIKKNIKIYENIKN